MIDGERRRVIGGSASVVRVRRSVWSRLRSATVVRLRVWWRYGRHGV